MGACPVSTTLANASPDPLKAHTRSAQHCMHADKVGELAGHLLLGTTGAQVLMLEPCGSRVAKTYKLLGTPAFLATMGTRVLPSLQHCMKRATSDSEKGGQPLAQLIADLRINHPNAPPPVSP